MGYKKVYLDIQEEEAIERIKTAREKEGRPKAAYNAILKEGLALVLAQELTLMDQGEPEANENSHRRRRRRGA